MNKLHAKFEIERKRMHEYIKTKLTNHDYHAVADAAMDLRELEVKIDFIKSFTNDHLKKLDLA